MSFTADTKREICGQKSLRQPSDIGSNLAAGMLLYGGRFDQNEISFCTEHKDVANKYAELLTAEMGKRNALVVERMARPGRDPMYLVQVREEEDRKRLWERFSRAAVLLHNNGSEEDYKRFLTGVYLVCGNVWDPEKGYRGEFRVGDETSAKILSLLLKKALHSPKQTLRRNTYLLYYTDSGQVEDLLTYVGAVKSTLRLMDVKILRDIRNRANRRTNCDTANITKTVETAMRQCECLQKLRERVIWHTLEPDLQEIARVRLENPQASLREMSEKLPGHPSRSTLSRKLNQLLELAQT